MFQNPDALPQLIGEFRPVDEWQAHLSHLFYALRGGRIREYYQTFAAADYRLAHALAADYYERVRAREKRVNREPSAVNRFTKDEPRFTIMEWGCGNGNLAACFLSHLKALDKDGQVYPRVRYVLVDNQPRMLDIARAHPDLAAHRARIDFLCANVAELGSVREHTVDRIIGNELWNDLPTKLMLRKEGETEEECLRPNLSEKKHAEMPDWSAFVRAFDEKDTRALEAFPAFLEDIIWEKEYRQTEWKSVPYRKTITEFLKKIDERVLVPVNLGAYATMKEAKRLLARDGIGFSGFDAGTSDLRVLNDPEKPCYTQVGGQYSFMVNFALAQAVAAHLGIQTTEIESQTEFVGRSLGTNVISLMDLLAAYPSAGLLKPWEQDRLVLKTIRAINQAYRSPYRRPLEFPLRADMPADERAALEGIRQALKQDGVPDTVAYLTEEEIIGSMHELEALGYDPDPVRAALRAPAQPVDYYHVHFRS